MPRKPRLRASLLWAACGAALALAARCPLPLWTAVSGTLRVPGGGVWAYRQAPAWDVLAQLPALVRGHGAAGAWAALPEARALLAAVLVAGAALGLGAYCLACRVAAGRTRRGCKYPSGSCSHPAS